MECKPITKFQEFIDRDIEEQKKFATEEIESNHDLLSGDDWPRVEELDLYGI